MISGCPLRKQAEFDFILAAFIPRFVVLIVSYHLKGCHVGSWMVSPGAILTVIVPEKISDIRVTGHLMRCRVVGCRI